MKVYADTNFFTNLLNELPQSEEAERLASELRDSGHGPLPVTMLLRMELVNALQRLVHESKHGTQWIPVTGQSVLMAEARFEMELDSGQSPPWAWAPISERVIFNIFHNLSHRHTAKHGFRTYDLIHVATALVLGCDTFWSFDMKAKKLAKIEGLKVN